MPALVDVISPNKCVHRTMPQHAHRHLGPEVCGTTSSNGDPRGQRTSTAMVLQGVRGPANRAQPHEGSPRPCCRTVTPEVAERSHAVADLVTKSLRFEFAGGAPASEWSTTAVAPRPHARCVALTERPFGERSAPRARAISPGEVNLEGCQDCVAVGGLDRAAVGRGPGRPPFDLTGSPFLPNLAMFS
jgi:hypothetical protein